MASPKYLINLAVVVAVFCILGSSVNCTPIDAPAAPITDNEAPTRREGRFYGLGGAQATAISSATAGGLGYPGFGGGSANAFAAANAGASSIGYPYGRK